MLRIAGVCALVLGTTGCLVESDPGPVMGTDMLGRVCTTELAVTGSFVQSKAPPVHEDGTPYTGCWPIGTWTFTASTGMGDCTTQPTLLAQYQFKVDEMLDADGLPYQVNTYMTDPAARNRVKVSQGGDGLCEGELNLFSADGKEVWILKPELYADNHLGGNGEYQLFKSDQWIGSDM
ncbi:MAG TPA: hypothetical protein VIV40_28360 [Kofleriaceae bacterium]